MGLGSFDDENVPFEVAIATLYPLPDGWAHGMLAVGLVGACSFAASTTLFLYISYWLVDWHRQPRASRAIVDNDNNNNDTTPNVPDLSLGLDPKYLVAAQETNPSSLSAIKRSTSHQSFSNTPPPSPRLGDSRKISANQPGAVHVSNPFLILIYNLLIADAISALEFTLCLAWVAGNGIFAPSPTCTLQGLIASVGVIAPAFFLTVIATQTYLAVVWGYKVEQRGLRWCLCGTWSLLILFPVLGIAITQNGKDYGGWYVRGDIWVSWERLPHYMLRFLRLPLCRPS